MINEAYNMFLQEEKLREICASHIINDAAALVACRPPSSSSNPRGFSNSHSPQATNSGVHNNEFNGSGFNGGGNRNSGNSTGTPSGGANRGNF